ncbi:proline-rich receptor-like protein kinase PERK3 isoform X1 [Arachis ipaensis]|uniref:proline-rich receptor-like protein kinase PERK3 isoform X1 n=1 Tax=Arachis ipaensis TaxID=130454 RepID=UPI000A2AF7A0|nr:proline-rich receptor-like protein kinase PERK3 isoform X1 [Arachis ipaensis]
MASKLGPPNPVPCAHYGQFFQKNPNLCQAVGCDCFHPSLVSPPLLYPPSLPSPQPPPPPLPSPPSLLPPPPPLSPSPLPPLALSPPMSPPPRLFFPDSPPPQTFLPTKPSSKPTQVLRFPPPTSTPAPFFSSSGLIVEMAAAITFAILIVVLCTFGIFHWKNRKREHDKSLGLKGNSGIMEMSSKNRIFRYEELAVATDGFSKANLLGEGGFGFVHKGLLPNGKEAAIKQLKDGSRQGEREFQAEVDIITRVHHRNLVSLLGYCMAGHHRLLVYEFVPNNTLEFHLHGQGPTIDWPTRMRIALGAAKGIAYLHEECYPKIIHRDIKAANILLDFNFQAKVADFGLAKFCPDMNTHVSTRVMGTLGYVAPEYASSGNLTEKADVFSFGVMLLELITGRRPIIDSHHTFMEKWFREFSQAMPLLTKVLKENNFEVVADQKLQNQYEPTEMVSMLASAAASIRYEAKLRPKMSQVIIKYS